MTRPLARAAALLTLALALGGCAASDLDALLGAKDAPVADPRAVATAAPERLWEAAAASDAMRLIDAEFGADDAPDKNTLAPVLAIDPMGGPASAALADAAARSGFETATDCAAAAPCLPVTLDVAALGQGSVLARLDVEGVLQASWAYRIEGAAIAPATGFTIGRRVAEAGIEVDGADRLARAIR